MQLNYVHFVKATREQEVFEFSCNITDTTGANYDTIYVSRPDDCYGLNPTLRKWLQENLDASIEPYVPPTEEHVRSSMPSLTARQLRLALVDCGLSLSQVPKAIGTLSTGIDRDRAQIEWEYATTYSRTHPLIAAIGAYFELPDKQIDELWMAAGGL